MVTDRLPLQRLRHLALLGGLIAVGAFCIAAANASTASATYFYCNLNTPPYSDCSIHLNTSQYNNNQSYVQNGDGDHVCERATIQYQAPNVSYRCGNSPVDSQCDLLGYAPGTTFSMYTGNNSAYTRYMVGKATSISGCV